MPLKSLTPQEKEDTTALLAAIERKDRRFRLFQTIFMVGTFLALIIIIGAQQKTLADVQNQQKQAEEIALESAKRSENQQDKIIRRLNCMVVFFSETDRQNLSINDIDRCTLNRDENIDQFFQQPESTPAEQPPNLEGSAPTATQENAEAPVPEQARTEPPASQPTVVEPRPPATIETPLVDIPLCVPLTGLCIR